LGGRFGRRRARERLLAGLEPKNDRRLRQPGFRTVPGKQRRLSHHNVRELVFERCVATTDTAIVRSMLSMTTDNLQHAEDHMLLLGRKTSIERVAAFLLEMHRRLSPAGVIALPMNRRDIADYLGLTLETVSRALSVIHKKGFLKFLGQTQRQIVVLNPAGLAEIDK
jgi:hypothetical protein